MVRASARIQSPSPRQLPWDPVAPQMPLTTTPYIPGPARTRLARIQLDSIALRVGDVSPVSATDKAAALHATQPSAHALPPSLPHHFRPRLLLYLQARLCCTQLYRNDRISLPSHRLNWHHPSAIHQSRCPARDQRTAHSRSDPSPLKRSIQLTPGHSRPMNVGFRSPLSVHGGSSTSPQESESPEDLHLSLAPTGPEISSNPSTKVASASSNMSQPDPPFHPPYGFRAEPFAYPYYPYQGPLHPPHQPLPWSQAPSPWSTHIHPTTTGEAEHPPDPYQHYQMPHHQQCLQQPPQSQPQPQQQQQQQYQHTIEADGSGTVPEPEAG